MKIWELNFVFDTFSELFYCKDGDSDFVLNNARTGVRLSNIWKPIPVRTGLNRKGKSDFPSGLIVPVFSDKAISILKDLIENQVEFLPLLHQEEKYYLLNIINIIDAVDVKSSVPKSRGDYIMSYDKIVFIPEKTHNAHIFKVNFPNTNRVYKNKIFVSEEFRLRVLQSKLTGFDFYEL